MRLSACIVSGVGSGTLRTRPTSASGILFASLTASRISRNGTVESLIGARLGISLFGIRAESGPARNGRALSRCTLPRRNAHQLFNVDGDALGRSTGDAAGVGDRERYHERPRLGVRVRSGHAAGLSSVAEVPLVNEGAAFGISGGTPVDAHGQRSVATILINIKAGRGRRVGGRGRGRARGAPASRAASAAAPAARREQTEPYKAEDTSSHR